jgi:hypothetical protein
MTPEIDPGVLAQWLQDAKLGFGLLQSAAGLLPKGPNRSAAEAKLAEAAAALEQSEANVAKALGYSLCKCTFPPQIMLWIEAEGADVCGTCGHRVTKRYKPRSVIGVVRGSGPGSWMR